MSFIFVIFKKPKTIVIAPSINCQAAQIINNLLSHFLSNIFNYYPFTPTDKDIDCKKYFCATKYRMNVGMIAIIAPAIKVGISATYIPCNNFSPGVIGILLMSENTIDGHRKSFHVPVKVNSATTNKTGLINGRITILKICQSLAPSIRAASSYAMGMLSINCRIRKILNTPVAAGKIIAHGVFAQPNVVIILYSGIMFMTAGNIIVDSRNMNKALRPRKRKRENANAECHVTTNTKIVDPPEITIEFKNQRKTGVLAVFSSKRV